MNIRTMLRRLSGLPPVRMLSIARSNRLLKKWRLENPGAPFANFYADRIETKLRSGRHHTTLGKRGRLAGRGAEIEWDRQSFERRGLQIWSDIVALGLEPHMRCVDYGCGSLRLGQHAMRYLDAGNYYGIDVTDAFIASGLELIDPQLLRDKAPRLGVINGEVLRGIRHWQADFVFSNAVLQHVPPEDLGLFFERLEAMMAPGTRAFILYITGQRIERFDSMSWSYPADYIRAAARSAAPSLTMDRVSAYKGRRSDGRRRDVLVLEKPVVAELATKTANDVRPVPGCAPANAKAGTQVAEDVRQPD